MTVDASTVLNTLVRWGIGGSIIGGSVGFLIAPCTAGIAGFLGVGMGEFANGKSDKNLERGLSYGFKTYVATPLICAGTLGITAAAVGAIWATFSQIKLA